MGDLSPPPLPTPSDFASVYLDESDRKENEEEDDHYEVVGGHICEAIYVRPYMFERAGNGASEGETQAHPCDGAEAFSLDAK